MARLVWLNHPSMENLDKLKIKHAVQHVTREAQGVFWVYVCCKVQNCNDQGGIAGVHMAVKCILGPTPHLTMELKDLNAHTLLEGCDQPKHWRECFTQLYGTKEPFNDQAPDSLDLMSVEDHLDNHQNLSKVVSALRCIKLGKDPTIPLEKLKLGIPCLTLEIHCVMCFCWEESIIPQDMKDAHLTTLFKNKGSRQDCNNYQVKFLLSLVNKIFRRVILGRFQVLADRMYPKSQCGFRKNRSTIDMVFILKLLQGKCIKQNKPFYIVFIGLTKAFDPVKRIRLYKVLERIRYLLKLLQMICAFMAEWLQESPLMGISLSHLT